MLLLSGRPLGADPNVRIGFASRKGIREARWTAPLSLCLRFPRSSDRHTRASVGKPSDATDPSFTQQPEASSSCSSYSSSASGGDASSRSDSLRPSMQPSVMPRPESASPPSPSPHEGPSAPPPVRSYSELYRLQQSQPVEVARAEPLADHASNEGGPAAGNASNEGGPAAGRKTLAASSSSSSGGIGMSRVGGDGDADSVASALSRAQQALDKAESSLEGIESLPSARQEAAAAEGGWRARLPHILAAARAAAIIVTVSALVLASHAFGLLVQWTAAVCGGLAVAAWGYKRGSLSASGALAAAAMGIATLGCSLRFGATLLAFFFTSSKLTQFKEELKEGLDDQAKKGGQRDWVQVCCNALVPSVLSVVYGVLVGCVDLPLGPLPNLEAWRCQAATALMGGFLGYYSCCCGDTWASELGPLSSDTPRLITTLRPVRKGTNGGVTLLGLSASLLGGTCLGAVFYLAAVASPTLFVFDQLHSLAIEQWRLIPLGLVAGLTGSLLDSLLGATLQYSGYNERSGRVTSTPGPGVSHIAGLPLLTNNAVNAVSASLTALLMALVSLKTFGF